jgi:hypothetical protein
MSSSGARRLVAPPTRRQVLGLYKEMVLASRSFQHSDPKWFLARVRQEFYKTDREPAERIKWFEVLRRTGTHHRPFPLLAVTMTSILRASLRDHFDLN